MQPLTETLLRIGRPRVLVVGDLILDRYTWGDAERVSPEAPVLVLRAEQEEVRPGGAASVAALLRGLEADVALVGVVGNDADGRVLQRIISDAGIENSLVFVDADRPTTTKERLLGRTNGRQPHQMLRVDRESRSPISRDQEQRLAESIAARLNDCDAVLISDYAKGVCTPTLLQSVIDACRRDGLPVLVDPARIADYERYRGATMLKPNRIELQLATGGSVATSRDAIALARRLCREFDLGAVVATLDRDGMVLVQADDEPHSIDTLPQEVCDVTGAGDMSLAMIGLCVAAKVPHSDAVRLANAAAGLQVQRLGIAPVLRREVIASLEPSQCPSRSKRVTMEQVASLAAAYREQGKRLVFTNGCFDLLHAGHVASLEEASSMGDILIVAVNGDASVRRLKGPSRPVIGEDHRAAMLAALTCVHHVVVFDEDTPHALLSAIRPHILVKGGTTPIIVGREIVERYGGQVRLLPPVPGISTSRILAAVIEKQQNPSVR